MPVRFQLRRDVSTSWSSSNPTLEPGEPGLETDTFKLKIGDGATSWNSLAYYPLTDFQNIQNLPTTIAGYGITDAFNGNYNNLTNKPTIPAAYTDSDVDTHLNTSTATTGEVLSWNGADYDWVAQSGGGGGIALTDLSVTSNAAGSAALTYDNTTGVFSYTPPDLSSYLTSYTETNDLTAAVTWANVPDTNITQSSVTQHQAALSITESQISDLGTYLTSETTTTLTSDSVNTKLVYTDETGTANDVDLSWAIDDTNLARLTSGTLDALTGIATFTRDDATTFTVDFSALLNITLADLSVGAEATASGDGGISYDNTTGVFTYTPPDLSTYQSVFTTNVITTNTAATKNNHYYLNASAITLTLPATPTVGDEVRISEVGGNTNCIIGANSSNIMGSGTDLTIDTAYSVIYLRYVDATVGWAFS